ncbi:MAG: hypothetical protein HQ546_04585 [Planctomycetes bacterium]|nr:hypothetical protein [Planctomycetota bacterium]
MIVAVVLAVGLLVLAAALMNAHKSAEIAPEPAPAVPKHTIDQQWRALCTKYYDWFGLFSADLNAQRRRQWQSSDEHLAAAVIGPLAGAKAEGLELAPRKLVAEVDWSLQEVVRKGAVPDRLAKELAEPAMRGKIARALELITAIEKALTPQSPENEGGWPLLTELAELVPAWGSRGWTGQVQELGARLEAVKIGPEIVRAVDALLVISPAVREVEQRWRAIEQDRLVIEQSGIGMLDGFGQYALSCVDVQSLARGGEGIEQLRGRLVDLAELAGELGGFVRSDWQDGIDHELVLANAELQGLISANEPTGQQFRTWLKELRSGRYDMLDPAEDPRRLWPANVAAMAAEVEENVAPLRQDYAETAEALRSRAQVLADRVEAVSRLRWDQRNRAAIELEALAVGAERKKLQIDLNSALADASTTLGEYTKSLPDSICEVDAINQAWRGRRDELSSQSATLSQLRKEIDQVKADLLQLADRLPAASLATVADARVTAGLLAGATAERNRLLAQAVAVMSWRNGELTDGKDKNFDEQVNTLRKEYDDWLAGSERIIQTVAQAAIMLDDGYLLDEAAGVVTIRQCQNTWGGEQPYSRDEVKKALEPIKQRIAAVDKAQQATDLPVLAAIAVQASQGQLTLARTAWRRLSEADRQWPASVEQLRTETRIRLNLDALYALLGDGPRKSQLLQELAEEGRRRWRGCFSAVATEPEVAEALSMRQAFGVDLSTEKEGSDFQALPAHARFNALLHGFRSDAGKVGQEGQLLAMRDRFVQVVRRHCPVLSREAPVEEMLVVLTAVGTDTAGDGGAKTIEALGPAWLGTEAEGGRRVTFTGPANSKDRHELTFLRVEPAGAPVAYLCTIETPVGLVSDVISAAGKGKALTDSGLLDGDAPRDHPCVWRARGVHVLLSSQWLAAGLQDLSRTNVYPAGMEPAPPAAGHPMQRVSPAVTLFVARLMNCRFPTQEEWRAAIAGEDNPAEQKWNLRDQTWLRQQQHMRALQKDRFRPAWPDAGIFCPAGAEPGPVAGDAVATTELDDGWLWFAPSPAEENFTFQHLIGNVAELVFSDPAGCIEALPNSPELTLEAVAAFVIARATSLGVLGGSALSPPNLWAVGNGPKGLGFARVYPVDPANMNGVAVDVGSRLAFTAPIESPTARLRRLLAGQPYLSAQK